MNQKIIKIGIFGLGRGSAFYQDILLNNGEIVAVCDKDPGKLAYAKKYLGEDVATYTEFDAFIQHKGMEAVFLCNFFHEHAPYAIKALERNIHVLSECTSNGTMAEGVALVRTAQKSQAMYMLSENYPFIQTNIEMRRVYRSGVLGKALFAEGEYNHPLDPADANTIRSLRPFKNHWRNLLPRSYYITHSLAPLMYMTGATPVRVTAFPAYAPFPKDSLEYFGADDRAAIITCLNDDDSVFRVTGCAAFGAHDNAYRICGEKGQIENLRGHNGTVMLRFNDWDVPEGMTNVQEYIPDLQDEDREIIEKSGHGGGDFLVMREFFRCIRQEERPLFDVYFATAMASVAILSHRSLLEGGMPYDIPDFRKEEDCKRYEKDTISPFYGSDGSQPTIHNASHPKQQLTPDELAYLEGLLNG